MSWDHEKSTLQEQFGALLSFITPIGDFLRKGLKRTFFETLYASCYELKHRPTCVILMVGGVGIISLYNLHAAVFIKSNFRSGALPHLIRVQTNSILIFPLDTIGIWNSDWFLIFVEWCNIFIIEHFFIILHVYGHCHLLL